MKVCLVVRPGTDPADLFAALDGPPPDAVAVWSGDPHLRPAESEDVPWIDLDLETPSGFAWNLLLLGLDPVAYGLCRASAAVGRRMAVSREPVLVLALGDVAVTSIPEIPVAPRGLALVERVVADPFDGLAPDLADLARVGRYSTAVVGFGAESGQVATALARVLASRPDAPCGPLFDAFVSSTDAPWEPLVGGSALGWTAPSPGASPLLDVSSLDRDEPWHLDVGGRVPRVRLSDDAALASQVDRTASQWATPAPTALRLPGGTEVDEAVRALVAAEIVAGAKGDGSPVSPPPDPYGSDPGGFLTWLETPWPPWGPDLGRYWVELWHRRIDLQFAFPDPLGSDRRAYVDWIEQRRRPGRPAPLVGPGTATTRPAWRDGGHRGGGLDLVGYPGTDNSLGDLARRFDAALSDAGIAHGVLDYRRSGSPRKGDADFDVELRYATNLLVINPDQLPGLVEEQPALRAPGRRTIGFWHWDVEYVPEHVRRASSLVDEIWVLTEFTRRSLGAAVDVPVRVLCVPVPEPTESGATRARLGLPDDRFVFLVTLDHLSVTERKNPLAAITAFRRAYPEPSSDGPVLVVKTANAAHRWASHERLRLAAAGRPDIVVVDRFLDRGDQLAMIARSDCLVSLHRSEGLGLHLMEAMWFAKPTIATRYSGNLSFMNDDNAALVDARLVPVEHGEGYFPPEATWADPDVDEAASWMRRIVSDQELSSRLGAAARRSMSQQASMASTGRRIAAMAGISGGSQ